MQFTTTNQPPKLSQGGMPSIGQNSPNLKSEAVPVTSKEGLRTLLRLSQVIVRTGLSRSSIYAYIKLDKFPKPYLIGDRAVRFLESEVEEWIGKKIGD